MGNDPGLGIDIEVHPLRRHIGLRIDQMHVPRCVNHAGKRLNRHVVGRQAHGALLDHNGPIRLVHILVLTIVDSIGRDIEGRRSGCRGARSHRLGFGPDETGKAQKKNSHENTNLVGYP